MQVRRLLFYSLDVMSRWGNHINSERWDTLVKNKWIAKQLLIKCLVHPVWTPFTKAVSDNAKQCYNQRKTHLIWISFEKTIRKTRCKDECVANTSYCTTRPNHGVVTIKTKACFVMQFGIPPNDVRTVYGAYGDKMAAFRSFGFVFDRYCVLAGSKLNLYEKNTVAIYCV